MEIKYNKILTIFIIITCGCYSKSTEKLPTEKTTLRYNPKGTFTRVGEHPMTEFMEFSSRDSKTSVIVIPSFEYQNPNKAFIIFYNKRTVLKGFGAILISAEANPVSCRKQKHVRMSFMLFVPSVCIRRLRRYGNRQDCRSYQEPCQNRGGLPLHLTTETIESWTANLEFHSVAPIRPLKKPAFSASVG